MKRPMEKQERSPADPFDPSNSGVFHDGAPISSGNDRGSEPAPGMSVGHSKSNIAFKEWREKLKRGDRMPRGVFFKGPVPQKIIYPFMQLIRAEQKRGTFELLNIPFPGAADTGLPWKTEAKTKHDN